jgi:hypothetical protein
MPGRQGRIRRRSTPIFRSGFVAPPIFKNDSDVNGTTTEVATLVAILTSADVNATTIELALVYFYIPKPKPRIYSDAVQRKSRW